MTTFPTDLRAPGALEQLLRAHRATFGHLRMEDTGDTPPEAPPEAPANPAPRTLEDVVAELGLTPEQIAGRLEAGKTWERRARSSSVVDRTDYEKVVQERDALRKQHETIHEKAVREAREAGLAEAQQQANSSAAAAAEAVLRIALRNAQPDISDEAVDEAVALTNLSALVTEDGGINEKKILVAAGRYAATARDINAGPDMGQGSRGSFRPTPGMGGAAEADRRFGTTA